MRERPEAEPRRLPDPAQRAQHGGMATKVVIAAAALLGTGYLASTHFPGATRPAPGVAPPLSQSPVPTPRPATHVGAQFSMIAPENAPAALRHSGLTPDQQRTILAAVKRREVRLVNMPLADATGLTGKTVVVSSAGIAQTVVLGPAPKSVLLPIRDIGEVLITPVGPPGATHTIADGVQMVALTALGPQLLPTLPSTDQQLVLDVIVQ
ncbi:hypothetical protein JZX93_02380 [Acidomonas methanolica]|nr:hypothetical protein [Acidomonas methanolica]